jgi:hypothetical protein
MRAFATAFAGCLLAKVLFGAVQVSPDLLTKPWGAKWIDVPQTSPQDYGVYHFRKTFTLAAKPGSFVVHVSGDNRYQLYVNGELVSWGPARGDLAHWRYETVDLAPHLRAGRNALAAVVWNEGSYRAIAQISNQTGFLLQADVAEHGDVNTGPGWKCTVDKAYAPFPIPPDQVTGYIANAANEHFEASLYPWGWQQVDFDDSSWANAHTVSPGAPRFSVDAPNRWMLVPRPIPLEELRPERIQKVRRTEGVQVPAGFPQSPDTVTFPAHARASLLLDQSYLTTGYPELVFSGGKGASVRIKYAEALYTRKKPINKGNRNEVDGKSIFGFADEYVADGGSHRLYRPLYWRTWRYIQLDVETAGQALTLDDIRGVYSAYPFTRRATLETGDSTADAEIQNILNTGWRTARLCAHETYMDCPYYEQLQYAGDARIQMLVSLYMTGDARLMRNGIEQLNSSRTAEGATYSRAPSHLQQYIPPFSLWWIGMVHDYWMYVDDPQFVKEMLPGVRAVLSFYAEYQKQNGSLQKMPWWNFVDWVKQWPRGVPPAEADGSSAAAIDLQLLLAYRWAGELEAALGNHALAADYSAHADQLKNTVAATDWDAAKGLFADQPSHRTYSQHVNTLAVLAGVVEPGRAQELVIRILADKEHAPASIYFRAYLNSTLRKVGLGDRYLASLGPWREMLSDGLTTWAEWNGSDSRSDCHAWGASPNFEFFRTILGVEPAAPGYAQVRIAPNLGNLHRVKAVVPHPKGEMTIELRLEGEKRVADIVLPAGVNGSLDWDGSRHSLQPGQNHIVY